MCRMFVQLNYHDHLARLDVGLLHSYALAFDFVLIHLVSISVSAINNDADLSVNQ